jgi:hypothetical protein
MIGCAWLIYEFLVTREPERSFNRKPFTTFQESARGRHAPGPPVFACPILRLYGFFLSQQLAVRERRPSLSPDK